MYRTVSGDFVKLVAIANKGTWYETMADDEGVHRYTRHDFGKVTGTDHKNPDRRYILPFYASPIVPRRFNRLGHLGSQGHKPYSADNTPTQLQAVSGLRRQATT
ncbi:hypothetical protein CYK37_06125 [Mesorhizobium loti]|nr:hypothetical protein CYK37_06125 [Mesorhizobium loti]